MSQKDSDLDTELHKLLEKKLKEGRLVNLVVDLLTSPTGSEVQINGVAVPLAAPQPPTSDKSCYKKCLTDCLKAPDEEACYRECIKKCKPKNQIGLEVVF